MRDRVTVALEVKDAFVRLGIVRPASWNRDKHQKHYLAIANYLLSNPPSEGTYKFVEALVRVMRDRNCAFLTPAACSNRARLQDASARLAQAPDMPPEDVYRRCRKMFKDCISMGVCKTERNILLSPVSRLPAWFRIMESGGDPEIVDCYMELAKEELDNDARLAEYVRGQCPIFK